jgi:cell wall-associated NlpC family hydrolase
VSVHDGGANLPLAARALERCADGEGAQTPGYCQRWARQCVQSLYGDTYDRFWRKSALLTAQAWLDAKEKRALPKGVQVFRACDVSDTRLGDLLYCTSGHGGFGHVGIRVLGNRVAENSVVHHGEHGAIGFRPLFHYREDPTPAFTFDVIVRLP